MDEYIRGSALNLFSANEPASIVLTKQGEFLVHPETHSAFNTAYFRTDYRQCVKVEEAVDGTLIRDWAEAFADGVYMPCGKFEPLRDGRFTFYTDRRTGLTVPPGALLLFKGCDYSYGSSNVFYAHTRGHHKKLVGIVEGIDLEAFRKTLNRRPNRNKRPRKNASEKPPEPERI